MIKKLSLILTGIIVTLGLLIFALYREDKNIIIDQSNNDLDSSKLISVLVDGVEQSAFPSKGSAEYQSTSCTNNETAVWDAENWKLSIQDISASTRCVVSFATGGHSVFVTVSGGTVDSAPKTVSHNGNATFTVSSSNSNYVFSSAKCTNAASYSWANNILSVNGVLSDSYCEVVFARPTYTVYFDITGGYTQDNYLTVVRGGGNQTTYGAISGYTININYGDGLDAGKCKVGCSAAKANGYDCLTCCDTGITMKIAGTRIVLSNVLASGDCKLALTQDLSTYLPEGGTYTRGEQQSYANLDWLIVGSDETTVTLILMGNATYQTTSSSNLTGTGIFGAGTTFANSSAKTYLQGVWLEQDAQQYLRAAIDNEAIVYQEDAGSYLRLPYASEVSRSLPNDSGTNFWTMDNDGNGHIYYGQPDGYLTEGYNSSDEKYYFEHYTLATNSTVSFSWSSYINGTFTRSVTTTGNSSTYVVQDSGTARTTSQFFSTAQTTQGSASSGTVYYWSENYTIFAYAYTCTASGMAYARTDFCYYPAVNSTWRCFVVYYANNTSCATKSATIVAKWNITGKYNVSATYSGTATSTTRATATKSVTGLSGTKYAAGASSVGYKYWKANVGTETYSQTATKNTTYTYDNVTAGNSSMTTAVQAVNPNAESARINDSAPTPTNTNTGSTTTHTALSSVGVGTALSPTVTAVNSYNSGASVTYNAYVSGISGSLCQGIGTSSRCVSGATAATKFTSYNSKTYAELGSPLPGTGYITTSTLATGGTTTTGASIAANKGTTTETKTYYRYTLKAHNSSTMGYRPVIVVKKTNMLESD